MITVCLPCSRKVSLRMEGNCQGVAEVGLPSSEWAQSSRQPPHSPGSGFWAGAGLQPPRSTMVEWQHCQRPGDHWRWWGKVAGLESIQTASPGSAGPGLGTGLLATWPRSGLGSQPVPVLSSRTLRWSWGPGWLLGDRNIWVTESPSCQTAPIHYHLKSC